MATTPEGRVKAATKKILATTPAYWFMPVSNGMGRMGVPDFVGVLGGRFIGIETKAGKGKPTALQVQALKRIDAAGGLALVINEKNLDYLAECLHDIRQAQSNWQQFADVLERAQTEPD